MKSHKKYRKKSKLLRKKNINNSKKRLYRNRNKSIYSKRGGSSSNNVFHNALTPEEHNALTQKQHNAKKKCEDEKGTWYGDDCYKDAIGSQRGGASNDNDSEFKNALTPEQHCTEILNGSWDDGDCYQDAIELIDLLHENETQLNPEEITHINNEIEKNSEEPSQPPSKDLIKTRIKEVFSFAEGDGKIIGINSTYTDTKDLDYVLKYIYQNKSESNAIVPDDDDNFNKIIEYFKFCEEKFVEAEEYANIQTGGGRGRVREILKKRPKLAAAIGVSLSVALGPITVLGAATAAAYKLKKYAKYTKHPIILLCKDTDKLFNEIKKIKKVMESELTAENTEPDFKKYLERIKEIIILIIKNRDSLEQSLEKIKSNKTSNESNSNLIELLSSECKNSSVGKGGGDRIEELTNLATNLIKNINNVLEQYESAYKCENS